MYFVYEYEYKGNIVWAYYNTSASKIVVGCSITSSLIKRHRIPHRLVKFNDNTIYWALIIDDEDAAFAILCGLNLAKIENNIGCTAQYINFLFNDDE